MGVFHIILEIFLLVKTFSFFSMVAALFDISGLGLFWVFQPNWIETTICLSSCSALAHWNPLVNPTVAVFVKLPIIGLDDFYFNEMTVYTI